MTVRAVLATVLLALASAAFARGGPDWINRKYSYCCGKDDCHEIEPSAVRHKVVNGEGIYEIEWRGRTFEVKESSALKSEVAKPVVCEDRPTNGIRCLFVLPMGA